MIFLQYLSPQGQQVYDLVSKKARFSENPPICRQKDIYGWFDAPSKTMTLCTDRIISRTQGPFYINQTIFHESIHFAQSCKSFLGTGMTPLGIAPAEMNLSSGQQKDLQNTVRAMGRSRFLVEKEAFAMENQPYKVLKYVKKFCF